MGIKKEDSKYKIDGEDLGYDLDAGKFISLKTNPHFVGLNFVDKVETKKVQEKLEKAIRKTCKLQIERLGKLAKQRAVIEELPVPVHHVTAD